jgi:hypothetical protein
VFFQKEVNVDNLTLIGALIELKQDTFYMIDEKLFDFDNFIFCPKSKSDYFKEDTIQTIIENYMIHKSTSQLSQYKFISDYANKGNMYRIGGDGGNRYLSLQIFCSLSNLNPMQQQLENIGLIFDEDAYNQLYSNI